MARLLSLLMLCVSLRAESLEDAARALARKVAAKLGPQEAPMVTSRNLTSLPASDAAKAQAAFSRALQRRPRDPMPVDIILTISESLRGFLLVAEIHRETSTAAEMVDYRPDAAPLPPRPALALEKKVLWEQPSPILDLALLGDQLLLLDSTHVARYERSVARWEFKETAALTPLRVRDPRGRLEINDNSIALELPGIVCKGSWRPSLTVQCEEGGRFAAPRNTMDLHDWRNAFFASAELGGDVLIADPDGRTHLYDAAHNQIAAFEGWGSDFVSMADACGATHIAATAPGERKSADSIALYDLANRAPVRVSDLTEFPGPVTALWPSGKGALAVARNLSTGSYAAYSLTVDCGR